MVGEKDGMARADAPGGGVPAGGPAEDGEFAQVVKTLQAGRRFALFLHLSPDGDSIGSTLALGLALERLGKRTVWVGADLPGDAYRFLPASDRFRLWNEVEEDWSQYDAAVLLDCADLDRVGPARAAIERIGRVVNVDHHPSNRRYGDVNYVEPGAAAVGEITARLIDALGVPLDTAMAYGLYTAILTDTGSFQYENTRPGTLRLAARLLELGVEPQRVSQSIFDQRPLRVLRLLREALGTLEVGAGGRLAWMTVSRAMMDRVGAHRGDTEGFVNYPRSLAGVEVALLFVEEPDGRVRISWRSNREVDVSRLAARFGGGGHARAAGCTLAGPLEKARVQVLQDVARYLEEQATEAAGPSPGPGGPGPGPWGGGEGPS
ncbi:phosphoesterase RecJ domain protein [Thermaerobacter marianensis DSM 12885]|uniref:Phosphoesterase RecJ domain protein n=1 Tax=Thermaerobacter marianensis (strain ATCC 700841 / DSM 12885 / JCM 10246 / 7p75a) TaxID=644966 RepID=E6SJS2_THEM7|nr:bifunctional oligoribonuclease/PAP phosphatase NrnA [Thermaerobacter marianensis]ADU51135.1 phosphoesterase RecJ domain protein [Thermaerobacter marianensis DSM 12885]